MRVAYVYANSRVARQHEIEAGRAPDTALLGLNHLREHGVDARIHEPRLDRVRARNGGLARFLWNVRELSVPLELRSYDVACAALGPLFPLAARATGGAATVLLNMSLCTRYERSSPRRRRLLVRGIRAADAVVCFAASQRRRLLEQTGADPRRVRLVHLGVDDAFLRARELPRADGHVLAVGRDLGRDYATFAAAVEGLAAPVVLVASGRNLVGVRLPPNARVVLDATPLELRELYEGAAAVVVPTRSEEFAFGADCSGQTVLLDALAMSRPVVISDRSTLGGYVEDGRNALVVPPEDPPALRAAIDRVLGDEELRVGLAREGRADVERRFTTRLLAERLAPVFAAAAGRAPLG